MQRIEGAVTSSFEFLRTLDDLIIQWLGFGLSLDENHFPYLMLHSPAFCDI